MRFGRFLEILKISENHKKKTQNTCKKKNDEYFPKIDRYIEVNCGVDCNRANGNSDLHKFHHESDNFMAKPALQAKRKRKGRTSREVFLITATYLTLKHNI